MDLYVYAYILMSIFLITEIKYDNLKFPQRNEVNVSSQSLWMIRGKFIKFSWTSGTGSFISFCFLTMAKELGNQKFSLLFLSFIFSVNQ